MSGGCPSMKARERLRENLRRSLQSAPRLPHCILLFHVTVGDWFIQPRRISGILERFRLTQVTEKQAARQSQSLAAQCSYGFLPRRPTANGLQLVQGGSNATSS